MSERYFAKVVGVVNSTTAVINAGDISGVKLGDRFLLVGLGDVIVDPDTGEELERLEIVRGKVQVIHVQTKIATVQSSELVRTGDVKEIKKITSRGSALANFLGPQDTVTESITPGQERLKDLTGLVIGDFAIRR
ncbi:hypothetical protein [Burkholderia ubonensis]|uniref:hypothetical protein n=1 Tax=Burkholderia ubonensis TaxID=101571 RepID=UPI0012F8B32A|nr:hypothetical protein [Burkholderia ubonensis]